LLPLDPKLRALLLSSFTAGFAPQAGIVAHQVPAAASSIKMETVKDLEKLADELNPIVGYWNPLKLGEEYAFWDGTTEGTIGWLRQAEIKHGRVAMFGFVGFVAQSSGACWPWDITPGVPFSSIAAAGGPGDQWDALPANAKWQILTFIAFLELVGEASNKVDGTPHYMRGGKPGYFPSLKKASPHPVPFDYFDPFGLSAKATPEKKAKGLLIELNNGRLAQIGLLGCLASTKGCIVPGIDSLPLAPYAGEYMKPFENGFGF